MSDILIYSIVMGFIVGMVGITAFNFISKKISKLEFKIQEHERTIIR